MGGEERERLFLPLNSDRAKLRLSPGMSFQAGKYLDFHHGTPEAVTLPYRDSRHSKSHSPCPSVPINTHLTAAPPAACPLEEKPAQTREVRSAARPRSPTPSG